MSQKQKRRNRGGSVKTGALSLRLYIAGQAPNSLLAVANLESICREHLEKNGYRVEVIDTLKEPMRALADGILVTPSLAKVSPPPAVQIVGNLNDKTQVLTALGLKE